MNDRLTDNRLAQILQAGYWDSDVCPVGAAELYLLALELKHFRKLPRHAGDCSNQNVLNPIGAYVGAQECGCRR